MAEFADCFQKRPVNDNDRARFEAEALERSLYRRGVGAQHQGGLMDTWRTSISKRDINVAGDKEAGG